MTNKEIIEHLLSIKQWGILTDRDRQALNLVIKELEERQTGEWIKGREISRTMIGDKVEHIDYKDYTCSNCGLVLDNLLYWHDGSLFYKFCPNCGADMMKGGAE